MKPIIEQLFEGEINAYEHFAWTDEYRESIKDFSNLEEEFLKRVSENVVQIYDELKDKSANCSAIESKIHFTYGFKLGFHIANEVLDDENVLNIK